MRFSSLIPSGTNVRLTTGLRGRTGGHSGTPSVSVPLLSLGRRGILRSLLCGSPTSQSSRRTGEYNYLPTCTTFSGESLVWDGALYGGKDNVPHP